MLSTLFQGVAGGLLDPIPVISLGEGRVHPGWWQRPPRKVPTAHQEQFWGSVSCSTCSSVLSRGTSNLPITSHLLYLLSYGRPAMFMWQYYLDEYWKYRDKKIIRNVSVNDITCNTALKTVSYHDKVQPRWCDGVLEMQVKDVLIAWDFKILHVILHFLSQQCQKCRVCISVSRLSRAPASDTGWTASCLQAECKCGAEPVNQPQTRGSGQRCPHTFDHILFNTRGLMQCCTTASGEVCLLWPTLCWCNMEPVIKGSCFLSVGRRLLSETEPAQGQIVAKPVSQPRCFVGQYIQATSLYNQPFCQWVRRRGCQDTAMRRRSRRRPDISSTVARYSSASQPASHQISSHSPSARHRNFLFSQTVCKPGYRATGKIIAVTAKRPASQRSWPSVD